MDITVISENVSLILKSLKSKKSYHSTRDRDRPKAIGLTISFYFELLGCGG